MSEILRLHGGAPVKLNREENEERARGFSMLAYTGDEVMLHLSPFGDAERVVFDLAGMDTERQNVPILMYHDGRMIAGHSTKIENNGRELVITGRLSSQTEEGRRVAGLSDEGFPWEASVGLEAKRFEEIAAGEEVEVNGREFVGPLVVARKSLLKESSFVPFGADSETRAVALSRAGRIETLSTEDTMSETKKGDAVDAVSQIQELQAAFPNDPAFVIEAMTNGWNVLEAKAHAFERLEAKNVEQREAAAKREAELVAERDAANAKAERAASNPPVAVNAAANTSSDAGDFAALVQAKIDKGMARAAAVSSVVKSHPEAHRAFLSAANSGRDPRSYNLIGVYA